MQAGKDDKFYTESKKKAGFCCFNFEMRNIGSKHITADGLSEWPDPSTGRTDWPAFPITGRGLTLKRYGIERIRIAVFRAVVCVAAVCACGLTKSQPRPLTYQISRRDFTSSVTAKGVVEAQRSQTLVAPRVRRQYQMEISYLAEEGSFLKAGDIAVEFSADVIRSKLDQALRDLETAGSDLKKLDAEQASRIDQIQAQILKSEASQASSRLKLAELDFVAPRERQIRELEIKRSGIEAAKSRKKLESIRSVHEKERAQQLLKIMQAERECDLARANIALFVLRTPVDGFVQLGMNWLTDERFKPGDNIFSGWIVATIPDITSMQVKLQLSETEVQNMEVGQAAQISIGSLGGLQLGGRITRVAQVAKSVSRNSDVKAVETIVAIDGVAEGLVPGLTAGCTLVKEKVANAVVVPLETVFERDSTKVVYALSGDRYSVREVVLGTRGADFVVVLDGLEGDEQLALTEPDNSLIAREDYSLLAK
jgi:HlyD family secretion protein